MTLIMWCKIMRTTFSFDKNIFNYVFDEKKTVYITCIHIHTMGKNDLYTYSRHFDITHIF